MVLPAEAATVVPDARVRDKFKAEVLVAAAALADAEGIPLARDAGAGIAECAWAFASACPPAPGGGTASPAPRAPAHGGGALICCDAHTQRVRQTRSRGTCGSLPRMRGARR